MEANKRYYKQEYSGSGYVDGNTVRKLKAVPDIYREEEEYELSQPRRHSTRQTKALSGISLASLLIMSTAIIATVFLCVNLLKAQSNINSMDKEIAAKQQKLITLTQDNDAAYENIKDTYDLNYVYHVAVEELGMVYPNKNKVITYQGSDDDYVKKYEDIPK